MVLVGFMFVFANLIPTSIYRWFMEMFVDSFDWVLLPNVYAMSQNADGGLITTKPYFSGSAYVKDEQQPPDRGPKLPPGWSLLAIGSIFGQKSTMVDDVCHVQQK